MSMIRKGQYIRLLLGAATNPEKVIAASKEMTLHLSASLEESSTKDTTGDYLENEITGLTGNIDFSGLVLSDDDTLGGNTAITLNDALTWVNDTLLYWRIALMEGDNNREIDEVLFSGTAKMTSVQVDATNRQNTTYRGTLSLQGPVTVASSS